MSPEAQKILDVFAQRGLRTGGLVQSWDFGDAIVWEHGFVRDEPVRQAIRELVDQGHLIEYNAGFGLTESGDKWLYGVGRCSAPGARRSRSGAVETRSMSTPKDGWMLSDAVQMVEQGYRPEQVQRLTGWASAHVLAQLSRRG